MLDCCGFAVDNATPQSMHPVFVDLAIKSQRYMPVLGGIARYMKSRRHAFRESFFCKNQGRGLSSKNEYTSHRTPHQVWSYARLITTCCEWSILTSMCFGLKVVKGPVTLCAHASNSIHTQGLIFSSFVPNETCTRDAYRRHQARATGRDSPWTKAGFAKNFESTSKAARSCA